MEEAKTCASCGMPLTSEIECSCAPGTCIHCCTCEPDCSCNCKQKASQ